VSDDRPGHEELACQECGQVFHGANIGAAAMRRGVHRKAAHPEEWQRDKDARPPAPKRSHSKKVTVSRETSAAESDVIPGQESFPGLGGTEEEPPVVVTEAEAVPRKPGRVQRFRARLGRRGRGTEVAASRERAPRSPTRGRPRRRLPLDADISDLWGFGGRRLENSPHYATGRMLQYQAPAAGVIIDRAVAGTLPDRVLFQPLARNRDRYEDVGFLLAGPLLTFSITTTIAQMQAASEAGDQEAYAELAGRLVMQREMFAWVLTMMLPRLAAGAKLAADKKAKRDAAIAAAFPELGDDDPVETLMAMLFQPPSFQEASQNGKPDPSTADLDDANTVQFRE
jgi:hypothetical protein